MAAAEPITPAALYQSYAQQEEAYSAAAETYVARVTNALKLEGVTPTLVEGRHKRPLELFKKQRRKHYEDPWVDCPDLVGVRVVVPLISERELVVRAMKGCDAFSSVDVEDQSAKDGPEVLAYRGLHLHLLCDDLANDDGRPIGCELQVRTTAEHGWASTEHKYVYKKSEGLPFEVQRVFKRLLVLVELFDQELSKGVEMVKALPAWEEFALVQQLEDVFERESGSAGDQETTRENIELFSEATGRGFAELRGTLDSYITNGLDGFRLLLREHGPSSAAFDPDRGWLTSQPEVLLVLALLEYDAYALSEGLALTDAYQYVEPVALWSGNTSFVRE